MSTTVKAFIGLFVFVVLMSLLGLIYKKVTGNTTVFKRTGKYMKTVDRMMLSNDKWIELIDVGGKIVFLGVTASNITKLDTFEMEELNELEPVRQSSFQDILDRHKDRKKN